MKSKHFSLPQAEAKLYYAEAARHGLTSIAMAGGREPAGKWLQTLLELNPHTKLYAADKGLKYFLGNNFLPSLVIGDADSAGKELFQEAKARGCEVLTYPTEKDETDLQLLLAKLPVGDVLMSGIWGGRYDHLYSNVFSLASAAQEKLGLVIMADEKELMFLLKAEEELKISFLQEQAVEAISLLPLTEVTCVSIQGVHWPLIKEKLHMYKPYAISNVLNEGMQLDCTCHEGMVGLYCCFK